MHLSSGMEEEPSCRVILSVSVSSVPQSIRVGSSQPAVSCSILCLSCSSIATIPNKLASFQKNKTNSQSKALNQSKLAAVKEHCVFLYLPPTRVQCVKQCSHFCCQLYVRDTVCKNEFVAYPTHRRPQHFQIGHVDCLHYLCLGACRLEEWRFRHLRNRCRRRNLNWDGPTNRKNIFSYI